MVGLVKMAIALVGLGIFVGFVLTQMGASSEWVQGPFFNFWIWVVIIGAGLEGICETIALITGKKKEESARVGFWFRF